MWIRTVSIKQYKVNVPQESHFLWWVDPWQVIDRSPSQWKRELGPRIGSPWSILFHCYLLWSLQPAPAIRWEKPQNASNHFWVVQTTLKQPNPNRHLRNHYFHEFLELLGHFELTRRSPAISCSQSDAYLAFGAMWKWGEPGQKKKKKTGENISTGIP